MVDVHKRGRTALKAKTRREAIYERLKSEVVSFRAFPGQHLSILQLSASFRSSNTPVREALIQLSAERLVDAGAAGGFLIRKFRLIEMQELLYLSRVLLTNCLQDAVHRFEEQGLSRPSALHSPSLYRATRVLRAHPEETAIFIAAIFRRIARMSGNKEITDIIENICDRTHQIRVWHVRETPSGRDFAEHLIALLDSLGRDDRGSSLLWLDKFLDQQIVRLPHVASKALAETFLNSET